MNGENIARSRWQTAQRLKIIIALIFQIFIALMSSMSAFADTDIGKEIQEEIDDLKLLLTAYKEGKIKENF